MTKSVDPEGNLGVYKRLADVPGHYRLSNFEAGYRKRDVWAEYVDANYPEPSETQTRHLRRFERRWKGHMDERGRHHALAKPIDVEAISAELVEGNAMSTAYSSYWGHLERFYSWLQNHTDYPHVYHPPIMAAAEYPNARKLWDFRIRSTGVKS